MNLPPRPAPVAAAALSVQPLRMRSEQAPRAMSLQPFNTVQPSSISLAELALVNGLDESARLRAGQAVERVTGTAPRMAGEADEGGAL